MPMPIRIMPPRMDAFPESAVPIFLPRYRPARQMAKVTAMMIRDAERAPENPSFAKVSPTDNASMEVATP